MLNIPDRFTVLSQLGSGGFGTVWKAVAPGDVLLAIKVPNDSSVDTLARFRREMLLQSDLNHPNIAEILDFDLKSDDPWSAMPLYEFNFESFVQDQATSGADVLEVFKQVLVGVAFAHENRVLHRDLKPGNVLVHIASGGRAEAKVADFGLSRRFTREAMTYQTQKGDGFVSDGYSAPEQYTQFANVDERADIYSLGRILQFCITLRPELGASHPALTHCVTIATRSEPRERYQSVVSMQFAIELSTAGPSALKRPVDQVRLAATAAYAVPDGVVELGELMTVLESHAGDYTVLQTLFSRLPYELVGRLAQAFPGQLNAVLRLYVESVSGNSPVDSARRAHNLLNYVASDVQDPALRATAITGLLIVATLYDVDHFSDVARGWLQSELEIDTVMALASAVDGRESVIAWMRVHLDLSLIPQVLAAIAHG